MRQASSYHPQDTARLVRANDIDNFALRFRYFLQIDRKGNKYDVKFQSSARSLSQPSVELLKHLRRRQESQLQALARCDIGICILDAQIDWRLIVGLGAEHVQEVNMMLHHVYGIPYIPGSAVKGVVRHWMIQEHFGDDEKKALKDNGFREMFGWQDEREHEGNQGNVTFYDAYPENIRFATDIMNPHFPRYYEGKAPPTDHQDPIPIFFLTVEQAVYRFAVSSRTEDLLSESKRYLQEALQMHGVGAKTAVGYGYFHDFRDKTPDLLSKLRLQQQAEHLENLSPVQRLIEEISGLSGNNTGSNRVILIFQQELRSFDQEDQRKIAQALKAYWERYGKWSGNLSRKQKAKVREIKSILGEA